MKNQKLQKQMAEVINLSTTSSNKAYTISFNEDGVLVHGVSSEGINPETVLVYSLQNRQKIFGGYVNRVNITDEIESICVAIDVRKTENPIVFLTKDNFISKINSKSTLLSEDIIVVYWEYGPYSFLSLTTYDLSEEKTITKCIFGKQPSNKGFCRRILLSLLPKEESLQFNKKLIGEINKNFEESVDSFYE